MTTTNTIDTTSEPEETIPFPRFWEVLISELNEVYLGANVEILASGPTHCLVRISRIDDIDLDPNKTDPVSTFETTIEYRGTLYAARMILFLGFIVEASTKLMSAMLMQQNFWPER